MAKKIVVDEQKLLDAPLAETFTKVYDIEDGTMCIKCSLLNASNLRRFKDGPPDGKFLGGLRNRYRQLYYTTFGYFDDHHRSDEYFNTVVQKEAAQCLKFRNKYPELSEVLDRYEQQGVVVYPDTLPFLSTPAKRRRLLQRLVNELKKKDLVEFV